MWWQQRTEVRALYQIQVDLRLDKIDAESRPTEPEAQNLRHSRAQFIVDR